MDSRIVDRRTGAGGVVEYRLREGAERNPLEETPETDTWKVSDDGMAADGQWAGGAVRYCVHTVVYGTVRSVRLSVCVYCTVCTARWRRTR